jgi:predicted NAD/FAD-binding protein
VKIAIVGAGVSGLTCAHVLSGAHDVEVFEAGDWIGGHTHTVDVKVDGSSLAVDTGFIVFNERNYPNFCALLAQLGVESRPTEMTFSVSCERSGLEWGGRDLNAVFAQRRNLLSPGFLRMLFEVTKFGDEAMAAVRTGRYRTLGELLRGEGYSQRFVEDYLVPMGAAIWSSSRQFMDEFPVEFFVKFFDNHGMLRLGERPQWRTVVGGSRTYVQRLIEPIRDRVHASTPVTSVRRYADHAEVQLASGATRCVDQVIFATHSDTTLGLLADATDDEEHVLGAIGYEPNDVVLHTDRSLLPRSERAWSAWNYHKDERARDGAAGVGVTYCMDILQGLSCTTPVCVTLNRTDRIDPRKVLGRWTYDHPRFTLDAVAAQGRYDLIGARNRTHFCGAYWFNGFHEDGVRSALRVCAALGMTLRSVGRERTRWRGAVPVAGGGR